MPNIMFGRARSRDSEKQDDSFWKGTSGRANVWAYYIRYLELTAKTNYDLDVATALTSFAGGVCINNKLQKFYHGLKIVTGITLIWKFRDTPSDGNFYFRNNTSVGPIVIVIKSIICTLVLTAYFCRTKV